MALLHTGQAAQAVTEFRQALALAPHNDGVARQYAWVLATHPEAAVRAPAEALAVAKRFADTTDPDPRWLDVLAAAQAAAGDFDAAVRTAEQAEVAAKNTGAVGLSQDIARRRAVYATRQGFVDLALRPPVPASSGP
jgi:predicted Zn-dependent protease